MKEKAFSPMKDDESPKNRPKDKGLSPEDRHLWDFVTRNIRPLWPHGKGDSAIIPASPPRKTGGKMHGGVEETRIFQPDFGLKAAPAPVADYGRNGLDRRTAERLRKGQMEIEARLDLHGLRQGEAQDHLTRFLTRGYHDGRRCVLVITGKGARSGAHRGETGILRRLVPVWLDMPPLAPLILSHCPARPHHGGDGAFYILLRRQR